MRLEEVNKESKVATLRRLKPAPCSESLPGSGNALSLRGTQWGRVEQEQKRTALVNQQHLCNSSQQKTLLRTVPLLGLQPSILGSAVDSFKNIFSHTFCFGAVTTGVPGR